MQKKTFITLGALAVIILIGLGAWHYNATPTYSYQLVGNETIASWDFKGPYEGNSDLQKKATDEVDRLQAKIGTKEFTDYSLYISIANQYHLLGDGKSEYSYLMKALAIDATGTGLAWRNLAVLLDQLGAKESARDAYQRASQAQPQIFEYRAAYLDYLTRNFANDTERIEAAFNEAKTVFVDNASLAEIRARWLVETGKYQEAIDAWKDVKKFSPQSASAVDAEIKRLEALR